MLLSRLRSLAGDSLVYGLSSIIARFISIWLTPIYTRILTQDDYGTMSLVTATIALIQTVASLALDNAAARWFFDASADDAPGRRRPFATWTWAHLSVALTASLALIALASPVSRGLSQSDALAPWLRLAALTIPMGVASSVAMTWLRMQRRPWLTVACVTGTTVLQIALTLLFVVGLRRGLSGIYWAQLIAGGVYVVVSVAVAKEAMHPRLFSAPLLRQMLRFSLPLIPAALAYWVVGSIDRFFIQRYVSTAEVGIFGIGSSIASLVTLAVWAFQQAWGPFALSIHQEADARRTYGAVFLGYCAGGSLAVAGLSLFAPVAIRIFATPAYDRASHVVGALAMSYVLMGLSSIVGIGYTIAKSSRPTAAAVGVSALVTVGLNALLVPKLGMVGSAIATLVGQGAQPAMLLSRARSVYHIDFAVGRGCSLLAVALGIGVAAEWLVPPLGVVGIAARTALLATVPVAALILGVVRPTQVKAGWHALLRMRGGAAPAQDAASA
jgi:O-antigen/teichoic acid export membrane protein